MSSSAEYLHKERIDSLVKQRIVTVSFRLQGREGCIPYVKKESLAMTAVTSPIFYH